MKFNSKMGYPVRILLIGLPMLLDHFINIEFVRIGSLAIATAYLVWLACNTKVTEDWRVRSCIRAALGEIALLLAYLACNTVRRNTYEAAVEGPDSIGRAAYCYAVEISDHLSWAALAIVVLLLAYGTIRTLNKQKAAGTKLNHV